MTKFADVFFEGEENPRRMTASGVLDYSRSHPGVKFTCKCTGCKQPVHLNDKPGAQAGFTAVDVETLRRKEEPKLPGFSHGKGNNGVECEFYKRFDQRFAGRDQTGKSGELQRAANVASITAMRNTLNDLEEALYCEMTGHVGMPDVVKAELAEIEKTLIGKVGLADRKNTHWLSYFKFSALSPQPREFPDGVRMVVFKPQGEVSQNVNRHNGRVEIAKIPANITLYYANPSDEVSVNGVTIRCRTTENGAYGLIMAIRERRAIPVEKPVATTPPVLQQQAISSVIRTDTPHSLIIRHPSRPKRRAVPVHPDQQPLI